MAVIGDAGRNDREVIEMAEAGRIVREVRPDYKAVRNREIYTRWKDGGTVIELAEEFGLSRQRIYIIVRSEKGRIKRSEVINPLAAHSSSMLAKEYMGAECAGRLDVVYREKVRRGELMMECMGCGGSFEVSVFEGSCWGCIEGEMDRGFALHDFKLIGDCCAERLLRRKRQG